jgi:hypothetical protein
MLIRRREMGRILNRAVAGLLEYHFDFVIAVGAILE